MTIGAGFIFGIGVVSGLLLAGLAFLIYLALTKPDTDTDTDLDEATARVTAAAGRLRGGVDKVEQATDTVTGIEPGE